MRQFTKSLITEWRKLKLPFATDTFVIAVSGGADSVALMLSLYELCERKKLENRFVVAHFNHNLRGEQSLEDAEFVRELTTKLNFEFAYKTQNPESKIENQKGNLEQNARNARYEFLTETAQNLHARFVLTAHTLNDQAETFLMNLIRGSGIDGLGGMKAKRDLEFEDKSQTPNLKSQIQLVRPLLNWAKREDTENFCLLNEIEFRRDAMNEDLKFNRVRVRKILLPMLKEFNPKIIETLARTAEQMSDVRCQMSVSSHPEKKELTVEDQETNIKDQTLSLKDLRDVFPSVLRTILRDWLKNNRGNLRGLELKHIEAIEKLIFSTRSGRTVQLPKGEIILKNGGKLHFQRTKVEKN